VVVLVAVREWEVDLAEAVEHTLAAEVMEDVERII
jgi:hypothetical protein